jgi:2-dehydropantoate 2-reductase
MKIAVIGVGGVGGYFGGQLAKAGHDVLFIARNQHLEALQNTGLTVESEISPVSRLRVEATDNPANYGDVDVVMIGVKLWDFEAALELTQPLVGPETLVVSFQNGVSSSSMISETFGKQRTMGGLCYIAATITEPGVIKHIGEFASLTIGGYDDGVDARVKAFADNCRASGVDTTVSPDIDQNIWEKFIFLSAFSGVTTLLGQPVGIVRSDTKARQMLQDAVDEATNVAIASGQKFGNDHVSKVMNYVDTLPEEMKSSMLVDWERNARIELPWLSGMVAAKGVTLGIPTPVHKKITDVLEAEREVR